MKSCGYSDIKTITIPSIIPEHSDVSGNIGYSAFEMSNAFSLSERTIRRELKKRNISSVNGKYFLDMKDAISIFMKIPSGYTISEISKLYGVPETSVRRKILGNYDYKLISNTKYYNISPSELRELFIKKES